MVEGSARARLGRAVNTRTTLAAQSLDLKVGDEVDFYRPLARRTPPGGTDLLKLPMLVARFEALLR